MKQSEGARYIYTFVSLPEFAALRKQIQSNLAVFPPQEALLFFISINEAVNNALFHGNNSDNNKRVILTLITLKKEVQVIICDEGNGFSCSEVQCSNLSSEKGRGLDFIKYGTDNFQYNAKGNELTLIKSFSSK